MRFLDKIKNNFTKAEYNAPQQLNTTDEVNCHEMVEDQLEILLDADIEQVQKFGASEHNLQQRVAEFIAVNGTKLKDWYSDNQINDKLVTVAKKAGAIVIYPVLLLYNLLKSPDVQSKDKMMIIAPLAYFVLPSDLIPDFILGLGYADDSIAIMTCIKTLSSSITPDITELTRTMCQELIGEENEDVINNVSKIIKENKETIADTVTKKYKEKKSKKRKVSNPVKQ